MFELWITQNIGLAWIGAIAICCIGLFIINWGIFNSHILYNVFVSFSIGICLIGSSIGKVAMVTIFPEDILNTQNLAYLIQEGKISQSEAEKFLPEIAKYDYKEMRARQKIGERKFKEAEKRIAVQDEKNKLDKKVDGYIEVLEAGGRV